MNTPAHAVLNLALLTRGRGRAHARAVLAGSLLPDLPMFGFYLWERLVSGLPEQVIWSEAYFRTSWQRFFDVFNSIPLAALALGLALAARRPGPAWFCAGVLLHALIDLPLHREDAHGHFFPLTDWRFVSPVSYWDPAHHGAVFAAFEGAIGLAASVVLWRRFPGWLARAALVAVNLLAAAGYLAFYVFQIVG